MGIYSIATVNGVGKGADLPKQDTAAKNGKDIPGWAGRLGEAAEVTIQGLYAEDKELTLEDLSEINYQFNKFFRMMHSNIQFALHERTNTLMVEVVDMDGNILKEMPPHEMLDVMANISEYIGTLLDKKA
ncbi:hypothetical protein P22_0499 [Propionispora sp. 2/2-37]|uniref:flagellar protein FlaG n=1 Tax=Propionispora sp. 2/2-37 TaxID=1677858 RepID=UPI0006BB6267|nr:flagellar protein FlaG [Propionispora sp. 2/2-37]CUH94433.1 hypothetical protein P22_0499 [Propionispora sp. 2/2-37]